MNARLLIAGAAAGITAFLLGWLVFGIALKGFYDANMIHYEGLMKPESEMNLAAMFAGNLLIGLLVAWACQRMGERTFTGGALTGGVLCLLFYASVDLMFLSMMNMYSGKAIVVVDILANTFWGAMAGGVAALVLGREPKAV